MRYIKYILILFLILCIGYFVLQNYGDAKTIEVKDVKATNVNKEQLGATITGTAYMASSSPITMAGNRTIYVQFNATNTYPSPSQAYIVLGESGLNDWAIFVLEGKVNWENTYNIFSGNSGRWSTPINTSTNYQMALRYDCSGNDAANPRMWLNGVEVTVTEETAPNASVSCGTHPVYVGGYLTSQHFRGTIGEVALFDGFLTDNEMVQLTSSKTRMIPLQYSSSTHYWPLWEAGDGGSVAGVTFNNYKGTTTLKGNSGTGFADNSLSNP